MFSLVGLGLNTFEYSTNILLQRRYTLPKRNPKPAYHEQDLVDFTSYRKEKRREVEILPRNLKQEQYVDLLENHKKPIVMSIGPAGTGKTLLACLYAVQELKSGRCKRVVITRPAVSVDEQHGFLPGTLEQKMDPWTRPIFDVFEEYWSIKTIAYMLEEKTIEICPLAYMRGRTFKDAIIIADEMQNATPSQMKMLLTRIGDRSKIIVTGDLAQHDRGYEKNGLWDFVQRLEKTKSGMVGSICFENKDIERHPAVADILRIYGED
jgi:phosphate starvation-inducible PhoH-like protein